MKRATQKDVAVLARVSQAAVSMVLSGGDVSSVSADTLVRIRQAVRDLDYVPNRSAQALKTNRTMTVACIVPDITNPFYPSLLRGVQTILEAENYDVISINTDGLRDREQHFLEWLRQGRVDGVIGVFWTVRAPEFAPLIEAGLPIVRIESAKKTGGSLAIDDIYVDGRSAAHDVTRYLVEKGHRQIGMIAGHGGPESVRVEGYRTALQAAGLDAQIVVDDVFTEEGGFRAALALLDGVLRPTAIFAANDLMAIGAMQAIRERGLSIPHDIAVVGFDDISASKLVSPPLTTVAQFQSGIGMKAAEILMERLSGRKTGAGTVLEMPFRLIERGSA
ncbi:LacI family DNA-binding transcriptional regulator [Pararhizobium sp. DWP3-4]|uniref:LacI family DNA-binding transcriptional regulator n=1 Tax=Pararhizobium sp. DWP3-4 TaxID=2804565 RepID=UPI003CF1E80B